MKLEIFNALKTLGLLSLLYKHGMINSAVANHYEIYLQVQAQMRINGENKNQAVLTTAAKMDIDESTVWKALKNITS